MNVFFLQIQIEMEIKIHHQKFFCGSCKSLSMRLDVKFSAIKANYDVLVEWKLTDFIAAILLVVERVHDPILRVDDADGSLAAAMVHRRDDIAADDIDHVHIQDIWRDNEKVNRAIRKQDKMKQLV